MSKEINLEEVFAEIYVPINDSIKRGEHIFDYNDMMLFAKAVVKKLTIADVVVPKGTLCYCGGNERVALDCTMKPCKHPKYFKQ